MSRSAKLLITLEIVASVPCYGKCNDARRLVTARRQSGYRIAGILMTEVIPPTLPLLAIMFGVLLFVTYVPETFMWLPRMFGFAR